jgi:FixJ family two-component response regulator
LLVGEPRPIEPGSRRRDEDAAVVPDGHDRCIAAALGISTDTVTRDWNMAKLWLRRQLRKGGSSGD